jgi:acetyltransferase-like isoleucine patch superfamily enzyme
MVNKLGLLNQIWNGRVEGSLGAILLALTSVLRKILNRATTLITTCNLGFAGKNVKIYRGIYYQNPSQIFIGNNVDIREKAFFSSETTTGKLEICDGVRLTENCRIDFSGGVKIGKNSLISKNVIIETHDHGFDPRSEPEYRALVIGEDVWIGMNSIILSHVEKIGDHAVIAVGAVVTKEVPDNCVVAGIPAKVRTKRP